MMLRLSPELKARIVRAAEADERSITQYVLRTLRDAVDAYEAKHAPPAAKKKKAAAR